MKTPIRYAGGKSKAYKIITEYIPKLPYPKRIISPFIGGGSLESKRSSERVRDFYNHKIYGERSVGSTFADFVIYPMAYVIGAYKVASSKIKTFKEKANC